MGAKDSNVCEELKARFIFGQNLSSAHSGIAVLPLCSAGTAINGAVG